jgi:membrane-bound lytic murein transglycosylase D
LRSEIFSPQSNITPNPTQHLRRFRVIQWQDVWSNRTLRPIRRFLLIAACAPLLLTLAGCPADEAASAAAPGHAAPNVTAPSAETIAAQQAQAQQAAQTAAANKQAQKVQQLIIRAEASYKSGVDNYNANRLDAARLDFDAAVDVMLASDMDLKSDPQLSDEFERLLSAINSLEMFALKQGNGFSPKVEEAPLESVTDMTFPPNPELVARLKSELDTTSDLPLVINDQVAGYINVFAQSNSFRAHMSASMQRLGKYRTLIQNVLKEEGVPQDLIYLAVAESGFQAQVVNTRSGAGGMWQFMTYTGPEYGLIRNGYFDYRFDPEKSTRAYARYMKNLHGLLGDWYLAMAAYDWGPGNIQRAVSRTGYADFWELYRHNVMPAETRAYVPQILAAVIMAKNPEKYGLNKLPPSPPVIYETVATNYAIGIPLVADVTGATVAEIVELNPALLRLSTPRDISYDLHIPPGTRDTYLERLKDIPEDKRASWRFHVVRPGETLDAIATSFHARASEIAEVNEVTTAKPLAPEDELVVPVASATVATGQQRYTMRRNDTLVKVADRFGVTVEQLRLWNHLSATRVPTGRSLYVAEPVRLAPGTHATRGRKAHGSGKRGKTSGKSSASHAASSRHTPAKSNAAKPSKKRRH